MGGVRGMGFEDGAPSGISMRGGADPEVVPPVGGAGGSFVAGGGGFEDGAPAGILMRGGTDPKGVPPVGGAGGSFVAGGGGFEDGARAGILMGGGTGPEGVPPVGRVPLGGVGWDNISRNLSRAVIFAST